MDQVTQPGSSAFILKNILLYNPPPHPETIAHDITQPVEILASQQP